MNRFFHNFPNIAANQHSRIHFRRWAVISSFAVGYTLACWLVDDSALKNDWFNRPDFKPYPAMVKKEGLVKEHEDYMMQKNYPWRYKWDYKRSAMYRFFYPERADWTLKSNPYSNLHARDVYNPQSGHYLTFTNDFQEHLPH